MSQRLTLDPSSFERLLAAALVLQHLHDQEARNRPPVRNETVAASAETDVEEHCVSERDPTSTHLIAALSASSKTPKAQDKSTTPEPAAAPASEEVSGTKVREVFPAAHHKLQHSAVGYDFRHTLQWFLDTAGGARKRLVSFPRNRAVASVTFDSKLVLSPRRTAAKAGTPLLVLLVMVAFTLLQVWHRQRPHTVAAMSRTTQPSDAETTRKGEQFEPTPPAQVSHLQVTDGGVLSVVEALSRYEIRGLRRQAEYGDDSAALVMGMVYETGRFVPQSCTKAAAWVRMSANWGNGAAQYNLGLRYRDGDGLPANQDEAEKWLRKAADHQYSNAGSALETLSSRDARSTDTPGGITDVPGH